MIKPVENAIVVTLPDGSPHILYKPHPVQLDFHQSNITNLVAIGSRGGGKAVALDTIIPTPDGMRTMAELKVGDSVFTASGARTKVVAKSAPHIDPTGTYKITFNDNTTVVCGGQHEWKTITKSELIKKTSSVKQTTELEKTLKIQHGRETNHRIPLASPWKTAYATLPIHPYVLGAWLGDGSKNCGQITTADHELIEHIRSCGYQVTKVPANKYAWTIKELASQLRKLDSTEVVKKRHGICGNCLKPRVLAARNLCYRCYLIPEVRKMAKKAFKGFKRFRDGVLGNKRIPEQYLNASVEQRLALLQGLMDTDGYCSKDSHKVEFCNTNRNLADGVYRLACSLGLRPSFGVGRAMLYGKDCGPKYRVSWTAVYPVFRLTRKLQHLPTTVRPTQKYRYVLNVEKIADQPVQCIQVAYPSHLYLVTQAGIPTHNSLMLRNDAHIRALSVPNSNLILIRKTFPDLLKALALDTLVPTPHGYRTIGDISVGDTVFAYDGSSTTVLAKSVQRVDPAGTYRITFDTGETIVCSAGHEWHTFSSLDDLGSVKTTEEIAQTVRPTHTLKTPNASFQIEKCEKIEDTVCQCIQVDHPSSQFLIGRGSIPTHNSHIIYLPTEMKMLGGTYHSTDHIAYYPNGSRLFLSYVGSANDAFNLLSAEFLAAYFDELSVIPWEFFTKLVASVRVAKGSGLTAVVRAATNPLGESIEEIQHYFVDKDVEPEADPDYIPEDWGSITINMEDNPTLDIDQYRKRFAGLPSHIKKAWLEGIYVPEHGIFDFTPTQDGKPYHVINDLDLEKIIQSATIYRSIDAGWYPDPTVCLWIAHLGNRYIVLKEKHWNKTIASEIAKDIKEVDIDLGIEKVAATFCLPLDAPVWMGDFTFKPLSEVKVGDEVIGTCNKRKPVTEAKNLRKGRNRNTVRFEDHLQRVKVTAVHRTRQEVRRLTMKSGRIIYCTPDHRWLSISSPNYKPYVIPRVGSKLTYVVDDPGPCPDILKAAWLGGIYDGEGCRNYIAQSRDHNPEVYTRIDQFLKELGFDSKPVYKKTSVKKYESGIRFNGGFDAAVKFSNWIPACRFYKAAERYLLISKYKERDTVVAIESCGIQDVGCLTTESGDFIAYGYVTSNCDPTMDIHTTADVRTVKDMYELNGIPLEPSINSREEFAYAIQTALKEEVEPGLPKLQIYVYGKQGCPTLAKTIPQQRFNQKYPAKMDDHKQDHWCVALAYFLISNSASDRRGFNGPKQVRPWMKEKPGSQFVLGSESVKEIYK